MLRQMIAEIKDEYLTQLPGTDVGSDWDGVASPDEDSMEALSAELDNIQLDSDTSVNFMGRGVSYEEMISIVGNFVVSHERRRLGDGGHKMDHLRKALKNAVVSALEDVPQIIADALAEELEDYVEDDRFDIEGPTPEEVAAYEASDGFNLEDE